MALLNIFNNSAFSTVELTEAINIKPNKYGRLQELNLFKERGVRGREVAIERKNGRLNVLPTVPVGGPATKNIMGTRDILTVAIPHIPLEDVVHASEVEGIRSFGTEDQLQGVQELVNDKLDTMRDKHDITKEYHRWGALKGAILDADGSSIVNLFGLFNAHPQTLSFALANSATEVITKVYALKDNTEVTAYGVTISGIKVFCSTGWFNSFTTHANVKDAFKYFQTNQPQGGDYRTNFTYGGVSFEVQNGTATTADGTVLKFVPDNEAIAIPLGADIYRTYNAPADFIETVNTPGLPYYAKQEIMKWDRGVDLHTQSNPLHIVTRPELLTRLTL